MGGCAGAACDQCGAVAATLVGATMSSTADKGANKCIDGAQPSSTESHCETTLQTNPWLSVELLDSATVTSVTMYNRHNDYHERLSDHEVWVGSTPGQITWPATLCIRARAPAGNGPIAETCDTSTGPHVGKFVTLVLPGTDRILHLREFIVNVVGNHLH